MKAPIAGLADFAALDPFFPFFRIIEQGLDGLAGPGHFFDILAEDITIDYVVTVPGYLRHVEGRAAVAELFAGTQAASVPGLAKASRWLPKPAMISKRPPRASTQAARVRSWRCCIS